MLRFVRAAGRRSAAPERPLEDIFLGIYASSREYPLDTRILTRDLLDNPSRAAHAKDWYLEPFLTELVSTLQRIKGFERVEFPTAFCMIYQMLGGIEYFSISNATLKRMHGAETYDSLRDAFPVELRDQLRRLIDAQAAKSA